jgi:hypothetical protein
VSGWEDDEEAFDQALDHLVTFVNGTLATCDMRLSAAALS